MDVVKTDISGVLLLKPRIFKDSRGYLIESYSLREYSKVGIDVGFVQDNESMSMKGVLRGLHYQRSSYAQAKLVRVIQGAVWDVAVDIRDGSPTYGRYTSALLSEENKHQMFIPRGFAHGFVVMEDHTIFSYKCDNYYAPQFDAGVRYDDPSINIQWPVLDIPYTLSDKDLSQPNLQNIEPWKIDKTVKSL